MPKPVETPAAEPDAEMVDAASPTADRLTGVYRFIGHATTVYPDYPLTVEPGDVVDFAARAARPGSRLDSWAAPDDGRWVAAPNASPTRARFDNEEAPEAPAEVPDEAPKRPRANATQTPDTGSAE